MVCTQQSSCSFSSGEVGAKISSVISLKNGSESALQTAVAYVGPVAVSVDASDKTFIVSVEQHLVLTPPLAL